MKDKKTNRIKKIVGLLLEKYPNPEIELTYNTVFQLLVSTILSAQCTDKRVNIVTEKLFKKYIKVEDFATAELSVFSKDINSINYFNTKAKNIISCANIILKEYDGEVPKRIESLIKLPGVGRKTANVILGDYYKIPSIVVDTHVKRLSFRLGFTREIKPERIEIDLKKRIAKKYWIVFSHLLILHGRRICKAIKPSCLNCFLEKICLKNGV